MDMKINSNIIFELRKSKVWSQQHLSDVSNLSLRTIQRVENNGTASNETIQSLASAFDVNVADLLVTDEPSANKSKVNWRKKGILATFGVTLLSCITYVSVVNANDIEINADERFSQDGIFETFKGNVGISIPKGKAMELNAQELWTSGDATFIQGGAKVIVGSTSIRFENGTLLVSEGVYLINTEEAVVSVL